MSADELQSAMKIGRLMNTNIYEFLCSVVRRVSDTLPAFMQGQLDEFNEKKAAIHLSFPDHFTSYSQDGGAHFDSRRVRDVEILLAEEKFNRKLLRFVRLYRSYLNYNILHGKREPTCSTKWIYSVFPRSDDHPKTKVLPATQLVQLIFERCSLRTDRFSARVIYDAEQESKWHMTVIPVRKAHPPPENYLPISEQYLNPPGHLGDSDDFIGQSDKSHHSRDVRRDYGALPEPDVPEIVRKLFGDRIPSTEELRRAITNHATTDENRGCETKDAVTCADKLVEAAIAKSRRKREALDTPLICPKTPRPDNHVTSPSCKSKADSKEKLHSDKQSDRKEFTCTRTSLGLCKDEIKTECTEGNASDSPPSTPVFTPGTPGMHTSGSYLVKKVHVAGYVLPLDDGVPAGPLATNVKIVEGSCYSDCIY